MGIYTNLKLLKKSVYDRWIDYGTIHGVTHHSIVCLTGTDENLSATVINPFLTQLVEMAILSLIQRSHQLLLFDRISEISKNFGIVEENGEDQFLEIEKLQEFYVRCQDQILLSEVTVQEQGAELYDMLQEQLYIPKNKAVIDAQMNNLRDVSNISHEREIRKADGILLEEERKSSKIFNWLAFVFSGLAIAAPFLENFADWLEENFSWNRVLVSLSFVAIQIVIVLVSYFSINANKKKNQNTKKNKTKTEPNH